MTRTIFGKVAWVGRTASMVFGVGSMAFAANGGNFVLGVLTNTATAVTKLTGNVAGKPALQVVNPNTGAGSHALQLITATGKPPLVVNATAGKAVNLNADKLDGKEAADFLGKNEKAADSEQLDGKDSAEFANATHAHSGADITSGTVAESHIDNSIARDNEVSNGFIQGRGIARHGAEAIPPDSGFYNIFFELPDPGFFLSYKCPTDLATNGSLRIRNTGSETVNVFSDNGSTNPNHFGQLAPTAAFEQGAAASGEFITLQVQGSSVTTIDVFSAHRSNDCHVQAQALVTKP